MNPQPPAESRQFPRALLSFLLPLILYIAIAIPLAFSNRERINPDAVAYIRRALYLSRGDFYHSLSGYWSPLFSWCIAPLISLGIDALHAARIITTIWGAIFLLAAGLFLNRFPSITFPFKLLALASLSLLIAPIAARQLTPDLIMAACLLFYFSLTLSPNLLRRPSLLLFTGAVGGLCYLAKSYALPVVLIHLPLTILLRRFVGPALPDNPAIRPAQPDLPAPEGRKTVAPGTSPGFAPTGITSPVGAKEPPAFSTFASIALALAGLALITLPFITILSWRYNRLTISTAGAHAHTDVGPPEIKAAIPDHFGPVPDPYITRHEIKESLAYPRWSPFDSREYFAHQLRVARSNAFAMHHNIRLFDLFQLTPIAAILALVSILRRRKLDPTRWQLLWLLLTLTLYCSGMLFVFFTPRYLLPIWAPLSLALCLTISLNLGSTPSEIANLKSEIKNPRWPIIRTIAASLILLSFTSPSIANLMEKEPRPPAYRQLAAKLHEHHIRGPLASPDRQQLLFISHFSNEKSLGFPPDDDATTAERKLLEAKPAALLIFKGKRIPREMQSTSRVASEISKSPRWKLAFEFPLLEKQSVEIYVPAQAKQD